MADIQRSHSPSPRGGRAGDTNGRNGQPGAGPAHWKRARARSTGGGPEKAPGADHALATSAPGLLALSTSYGGEWWAPGQLIGTVQQVTGTSKALDTAVRDDLIPEGHPPPALPPLAAGSGPFEEARGGPIEPESHRGPTRHLQGRQGAPLGAPLARCGAGLNGGASGMSICSLLRGTA